ncbi:MAG: hypothetical protein K8R92_09690 [Planctomycetes bacterium]|nr:hypothetical protein [Planctomycetota bacterium]
MTDPSPWSDGAPTRKPSSSSGRFAPSMGLIVVLLLLGVGIGGGAAWLMNSAAIGAKERERAGAVADLAALSIKMDAAESAARDAKKLLDEAQKKSADAGRQAEEATRQLADARKDASSVRTERDEERAKSTVLRGEMDKERTLDVNPATLPVADLSRAINGVKAVRCSAVVSIATPAPGMSDTEAKTQLTQALTGVGMTCSEQSPVEIMLLVSLSDEQPRRALGVMLMVVRAMKVPGEPLSRQSAVWGQQRISLVNSASAATQLDALIKELVTAMSADLAVKSGPPSAPPAAPPAAAPSNTPVTPPAQPPATVPANGTP